MNELTFSEKGFEEYLYWQTQDKKTLKKINSLLEDIKLDILPTTKVGGFMSD